MSKSVYTMVSPFLGAAAVLLAAAPLTAATYLPLSDADLARRSPVIVRARVVSTEARLDTIGEDEFPFTYAYLEPLELVKGRLRGESFQVRLPGGRIGDRAWALPGTPVFSPDEEVLLFLASSRGHSGEYRLTEFGMSKFDIVEDSRHTRFAVRPAFTPEEDDYLSGREPAIVPARAAVSRRLRDADSFLTSLAAVAGGASEVPTEYAVPDVASAADSTGMAHPLWVNIGGVEGSSNLFRWFWDTGASPSAVVATTGSQANLSDGSNGVAHVQNGVDGWHGVAGADVRYGGVAPTGNVVVNLGATSSFDGGSAWNTALPCNSGGVIGLGGPGTSSGPRTFKGDSPYFSPSSGTVSMRQRTGSSGCYSAALFRSAVLHELGHTLGLGHSDEGASTHSSNSAGSAASATAVMHSVIPASAPSTPQPDDVQAIQYYYGTSVAPAPVASFNAPGSATVGQNVTFTDTSTGTPTAWAWTFGDGAVSAAQSPAHAYTIPGTYSVRLTASNANGSSSATGTVTAVAPVLPTPVANFGFSPSAPSAGHAVQFVDTSAGGPTAWRWSFGDPASGAANSSTLQNPSHTFAAAGPYSVTLSASNAGGTAARTAVVTVAEPPVSEMAPVRLPVAGHVTGVGGVVFVTDAHIENPNAMSVGADLLFFRVGGGVPARTSLTLGPFETRPLPDVVATQFGVTDSFGALRLDALGSPPAPLRMTSRTYDRVGGGSFGMAISGFPDGTPSTAPRLVTGLQRNDAFRTNLGAVNDSANVESFVVVLRGPSGSVLGVSPTVTLAPGGQWQLGLKDLFPAAFGTAMTAEFQSVSASAVPFAYASLADNQSGELTYFPSLRPSSLLFLPVISRVTGFGGALFSSEITISNASDSFAPVTMTFWERDRDNSSAARQTTIALAPRETRAIPDAANALFGVSETFGAVKVESAVPIAIGERIWTSSPTTPGTVGQQVDPITTDALYTRASILGLRQDSAFRSNVGLVNPNDLAAPVALTLRRSNGAVLATASVTIPARGFVQSALPALFPGAGFAADEPFTVSIDARSARICAYGIVADNVSQDLTASPALP